MSPLQLVSAFLLLTILTSSCVKGAPIDYEQEFEDEDPKIYYLLYTRKNPNEFQRLELNDLEALKKSNYNPKVDVKFYCPGMENNGSIVITAKDEYLMREDVNVFSMDWRAIQNPDYSNMLNATVQAGFNTGAFIDFLIDYGTPRSAFHLIGHSAGCHLAGIAGSSVSSGKIPRITGLDPSRMPVETPTDYFLDKDDADFVDVVHTNGGMDYDDRAIIDPSGHVDFYANGGHHQPGCEDNHCNHLRAKDLFAESINTRVGFRALRCDNYEDFQKGLCDGNESELMGDHTPSNIRGIFHFDTNAESPFARG